MAKESKRQAQVAELLRRNMGLVLQQEGTYIYENALVTVTNVIVAPDLLTAKIYLSVYNTDNKQAVLLLIEDSQAQLQNALSRRLRKQIRRSPIVRFFLDDTLDEMYRITSMFNKMEREKQFGEREEDEKEDA